MEDKDIKDIREGLLLREQSVKHAENQIRRQHDYHFVLAYLSASRDLHHTLVANVDYLANEVEQLRTQVDHAKESIAIMEEQFTEIETKYDRVVGGLVHRAAFQSKVEGTLYVMISRGTAALKAAADEAQRVLAGMELGPESLPHSDAQAAQGLNHDGRHGHTSGDLSIDRGKEQADEGAGGTVTNNGIKWDSRSQGRDRGNSDTNEDMQGSAASSVELGTGGTGGMGSRCKEQSQRPGVRDARELSQSSTSREAHPEEKEDPCPPPEDYVTRNPTGKRKVVWLAPEPSSSGGDGHRGTGLRGQQDDPLGMGECLRQMEETHRAACERHSAVTRHLEQCLAQAQAKAADASAKGAKEATRADRWEARHADLLERHTELQSYTSRELALAELRADESLRKALEEAARREEGLGRATPVLAGMVAAFAPQETEALGVDLFQRLGIDRDQYAHIVAGKHMFMADLESRASEILAREEEMEAVAGGAETTEAAKSEQRGRSKGRGGKSNKGSSGKKGKTPSPAGKPGTSNSGTRVKKPSPSPTKKAKGGSTAGSATGTPGGKGNREKAGGKEGKKSKGGAGAKAKAKTKALKGAG